MLYQNSSPPPKKKEKSHVPVLSYYSKEQFSPRAKTVQNTQHIHHAPSLFTFPDLHRKVLSFWPTHPQHLPVLMEVAGFHPHLLHPSPPQKCMPCSLFPCFWFLIPRAHPVWERGLSLPTREHQFCAKHWSSGSNGKNQKGFLSPPKSWETMRWEAERYILIIRTNCKKWVSKIRVGT